MKIKVLEANWSSDRKGTWVSFLADLGEEAKILCDELIPGEEYTVELKRFRKARSLDANAYCWVLIDRLSEKLRIGKEEIYKNAIRDIGGVSDTVCVREAAVDKLRQIWESRGIGWQSDTMPSKIDGCVNVILYSGSSVYDSKSHC